MGNDFGDLGAGDAVFLRLLKMEAQRTVGDALADERGDRYQAAVAKTEAVSAAPHLTEEDIVVEFRELGSELAELCASGGLYYFLLCHNLEG